MAAKKSTKKRLRGKVKIPGVDKPVWVSAFTRSELEEKKRIVRETYIDGVQPREMTFHQVVIEWFETIKKPRIKKEGTLNNYRGVINKHILPYFPEQKLCRAIRRADLQSCVDQLKGMNANTITLAMSIIKRSMEYAMSEGATQRNPSEALIRPLAGDSVEKDAFTDEQVARLFKAANNHPNGILIYVLYYFGLRIGEAVGLRWGDFDWERNMIHVERQVELSHKKADAINDLKTKKSDRYIGIPNQAREYFFNRRELPNVYVVHQENGDHLTKSTQRHIWIELMLDAGYAHLKEEYLADKKVALDLGLPIPEPRIDKDYEVELTPHWFRHNYSTILFEGEVDPLTAMRLLGHSNYQTTANVYTHVKEKILQKAAIKLDSIFDAKYASFDSKLGGCNQVANNQLFESATSRKK